MPSRLSGRRLPVVARPRADRAVSLHTEGAVRDGLSGPGQRSATLAYAAHPVAAFIEEPPVPKPNYAFEKRQRELEKKRKKEEKAQRKHVRGDAPDSGAAPNEATAPAPPPAER